MTARATPLSCILRVTFLAIVAFGVVVTAGVASAEDQPFVYHAHLDKIEFVSAAAGPAETPGLPSSLVIAPGRYAFAGKTYVLRKPGLYRFCRPLKEIQQRIVYDVNGGDAEALLSALAWTASHGNADNPKSNEELTQKATTAKLFITCGRISAWAVHILMRQDIQARPVSTLTLDEWNSYDNGHSMIEVYRDDLKKWILYDLDENVCFVHNATPLSLVEMVDRSATGDYEVKTLAADTMLDVSNFKTNGGYDLAFFMEAIQTSDGCRWWYKRAMQVPIINNCFYLRSPNDADRRRVQSYCKSAEYLEKNVFLNKFYQGEVQCKH